MALTDALGNLIDLQLMPGQAHDLRDTAALIDGLTCGQFLADRAFDANWLRDALTDAGIEAAIPPKNSTVGSRLPLTAIPINGGT
jgi:transposase